MLAAASDHGFDGDTLNLYWDAIVKMSLDKTTHHENNVDSFGSFTHGDGWGIVWVVDGKIKSHHSTSAIWQDNLPLETINDRQQITFMLIHTRKASPGLETGLKFCHPFIRSTSIGDVAFSHNGTIDNREAISYSSKYTLEVDSDTERFLYAIISKFESEPNQEKMTLLRTVIQELPDYSGANYFFLTPENLWVSTNFSKNPKYFTMYYTINEGFIVVSSEKFDSIPSEWQKLQNHNILELKKQNGLEHKLVIG
jgi:predicted glutamine amidotransferase